MLFGAALRLDNPTESRLRVADAKRVIGEWLEGNGSVIVVVAEGGIVIFVNSINDVDKSRKKITVVIMSRQKIRLLWAST